MNLNVLRKFTNPKGNVMEQMLKMVLPSLMGILEKINQPVSNGGTLGENDFASGIAIFANEDQPTAMVINLSKNEDGKVIISKKILLSELKNPSEDGK
jgi:hypothetical protein